MRRDWGIFYLCVYLAASAMASEHASSKPTANETAKARATANEPAQATAIDPTGRYLTGVKSGEICRAEVCTTWQTDLVLFNPWEQPAKVELALLTPKRVIPKSIMLAAGQRMEIANVGAKLFKSSGASILQISSDREVDSRAYVYRPQTTEGRFSQPAVEATVDAIHAGETAELSRVLSDAVGAQSSVIVANVGGGDADVEIDVANEQKTLSQTRHHLAAYETVELPLRQLVTQEPHDVRVSAKHVQGNGAIVLSGNTRGIATGDGFHIAAAAKSAGSRRRAVRTGALLNGRVVLDLYISVAPEDRQAIASNRALLEGNGYVIAADASRVDLPAAPAAGYRVQLGTNSSATDAQGNFWISIPNGGPTVGQVFHPATPDALGTFTVASVQSHAPVVLALQFGSVCGMNASDTQLANCHTGTASDIVGIMGVTYPPTRRADSCEQLDGFISSNVSPLASYFGSTCQKRVVQGCCPNEGGWGIFSASICCVKNHRGRYCQEVTPSDISILGDSEVIVDLAETDTFTLHNNSCFGDSNMVVISRDINGSLTGGGLTGNQVQHYDATKLAAFSCANGSNASAYQIWIGDRTLTHTTPKCVDNVSGGEDDQYLFEADGTAVMMTFTLKPDLLYQFLGGTTVFSLNSSVKDGWHIANPDTGCAAIHLHGNHPCTGLPDPAPHNCGWGMVQKVAK